MAALRSRWVRQRWGELELRDGWVAKSTVVKERLLTSSVQVGVVERVKAALSMTPTNAVGWRARTLSGSRMARAAETMRTR